MARSEFISEAASGLSLLLNILDPRHSWSQLIAGAGNNVRIMSPRDQILTLGGRSCSREMKGD